MPTGTACKGFVGWLFLHPLQNRTNRAILTYIIMQTRADMADLVMRNIQKALSGQAVITPVPGTRKD